MVGRELAEKILAVVEAISQRLDAVERLVGGRV
jgi:hypothetical protein